MSMKELMQGGPEDEQRIEGDAGVRKWAARWSVPEHDLRRAISQVGTRVKDVRQHLVGGFTDAAPSS